MKNLKVGDRVKVLKATLDTPLLGRTVSVTRIEDNKYWVEGSSGFWLGAHGLEYVGKNSKSFRRATNLLKVFEDAT